MRKARLLPNALQPNEKYPFGYFKGSSTPEAKDGTPILADTANDIYGAHSALLKEAGMEANGVGEGVGSSQVLDAIKKLIQNSATSLNNSLQAIINKLRSDMTEGDKDTLSSANKYTDDSIQIQDGKAQQYAANARTSSTTYTNKQIAVVNERIGGLSKGNIAGLENLRNYPISDDVESKSDQYASSKAVFDAKSEAIASVANFERSYTKTTLFSSESGVTPSSINLSDNLWDYDEVIIYTTRNTEVYSSIHKTFALKDAQYMSRTSRCNLPTGRLDYDPPERHDKPWTVNISDDGRTIVSHSTPRVLTIYKITGLKTSFKPKPN